MHYSFSGSLLLSIAGMMIVVVRGSDFRGTNNYFLHYLMGKVWYVHVGKSTIRAQSFKDFLSNSPLRYRKSIFSFGR